jgi:hypothetical protein
MQDLAFREDKLVDVGEPLECGSGRRNEVGELPAQCSENFGLTQKTSHPFEAN